MGSKVDYSVGDRWGQRSSRCRSIMPLDRVIAQVIAGTLGALKFGKWAARMYW